MKVKVNDQYNFDVEVANKVLKVDGSILEIDSTLISDTLSHIIRQHKSYNVELVEKDPSGKLCTVKVNGNIYRVEITDQYDELLKQLGLDNASAHKVQEIKAPMPGLVLNVIVAEGQEVSKGESLLVLEAMKMENIIKSPTAGMIKKILVKQGNKVEKNEILIQFS